MLYNQSYTIAFVYFVLFLFLERHKCLFLKMVNEEGILGKLKYMSSQLKSKLNSSNSRLSVNYLCQFLQLENPCET